jgi:hypothetical protein
MGTGGGGGGGQGAGPHGPPVPALASPPDTGAAHSGSDWALTDAAIRPAPSATMRNDRINMRGRKWRPPDDAGDRREDCAKAGRTYASVSKEQAGVGAIWAGFGRELLAVDGRMARW